MKDDDLFFWLSSYSVCQGTFPKKSTSTSTFVVPNLVPPLMLGFSVLSGFRSFPRVSVRAKNFI